MYHTDSCFMYLDLSIPTLMLVITCDVHPLRHAQKRNFVLSYGIQTDNVALVTTCFK